MSGLARVAVTRSRWPSICVSTTMSAQNSIPPQTSKSAISQLVPHRTSRLVAAALAGNAGFWMVKLQLPLSDFGKIASQGGGNAEDRNESANLVYDGNSDAHHTERPIDARCNELNERRCTRLLAP